MDNKDIKPRILRDVLSDFRNKENEHNRNKEEQQQELKKSVPQLRINREDGLIHGMRRELIGLRKEIENKSRYTGRSSDIIRSRQLVNMIARKDFEKDTIKIGAIILHKPVENGENYDIRYKGNTYRVRVRGTFNKEDGVTLIRAKYTWWDGHHVPDIFHVVSGVRYEEMENYNIKKNDARTHKRVLQSQSDEPSFTLSFNNIVKLNDNKILG